MSEEFQPNPLQAMRGQPWQRYEASPMLYAAVEWISNKLETTLWNRMQREVRNPFNKDSGTTFETEGLSIYGSRDWDEGSKPQHWNLKCGDIELSWYRHSWCWLSSNRQLTNDAIAGFLDEALAIVDRCNCDHDYYGKKGEQEFFFDGERIGESSFQRACREEREKLGLTEPPEDEEDEPEGSNEPQRPASRIA
jgi:hypothetical protein